MSLCLSRYRQSSFRLHKSSIVAKEKTVELNVCFEAVFVAVSVVMCVVARARTWTTAKDCACSNDNGDGDK